MPEPADQIHKLDVAPMVADMRPPTDDDVPITLDGRRLDAPEKVFTFVHEINEQRAAEEQRDG
jgi:hypothetical protein